MAKADLYQIVTDKIIAQMEKGAMPWERPWRKNARVVAGMPVNAVTKKPYRGINIMLLWLAADELNVSDMRFLTFKQAQAAGGSVKKGSKGFAIYFFTTFEVEDRDTGKLKKIPVLRYYTVFHVSQTEGCRFHEIIPTKVEALPEDTAELTAALDCKVTHGGDRACYIPSIDRIQMPEVGDFKTKDGYRATLYHEITHWTGAKHRMARDLSGNFGSHSYAREELVAELGGAFMCAEFGLEYQTQHADYLASWLKVLKEDKKAIMQAASAAQKAVDWIRNTVLHTETTATDELEAA